LAMLSKLGHKTAFVGKVGNDFFGEQLKDAITEVGIDAAYLRMDEQVHTTLAMVHTYPDGDRDFSFYRDPGADMMLAEDEIPEELIKDSDIFHFGTLSMTHEGVRAATKKAIRIAKEAGALISFDPNLRPPLWKDMNEARIQVLYGLENCHILKISDNEIQWLTGKEDYTEGVEWINERYRIPLILVSMGKQGSRAYYKGMMVEVSPFLQKNTVETTGAGDTFCGCVLHYICEHGLSDLSEDNLREMLVFANAAASLITTRKGALRVMPEMGEVQALIENQK
ncbi:MAG: carbohydrate kinase, partial [Lachnospiraceae bacterium]|nr:carbohydrate kinase [Lachnospiraceae bacterium]